ncbi:MAG TPA: type II toxin-antitoxin system PemK/MazF family toxin [Bryobacteraceae bacterium]
MICEAWSVVAVPFPFSDSPDVKFRPAVVLSTHGFNRGGLSIMAMVTSARHSKMHGDIGIKAGTAGLPKDSVIRMKLFTLDNRLIRSKLGAIPHELGVRLGDHLRSTLRWE